MSDEKKNLVVVTGPTASGKTRLAALLAHKLRGEVISADSMQVYRGMDIGTGKDLVDYEVEGHQVPVHLLDICEAGEKYDVFRYQKDFNLVFADLLARRSLPVMCGGTGLYVQAASQQYDLPQVPQNPALREDLQQRSMEQLQGIFLNLEPRPHNTTDLKDRDRLVRAIEIARYKKEHPEKQQELLQPRPLYFLVHFPRELQKQRICQRLHQRLETGMVEETQGLLDRGVPATVLEYYGLEYRYISLFLRGELSYNEMFEKLNIAIRQFAKRQMTWFRRMEKQGAVLHWVPGEWPLKEKLDFCMKVIEVEVEI